MLSYSGKTTVNEDEAHALTTARFWSCDGTNRKLFCLLAAVIDGHVPETQVHWIAHAAVVVPLHLSSFPRLKAPVTGDRYVAVDDLAARS